MRPVDQRGLTLIELMVIIVLTPIIVIVMYNSFNQSIRAYFSLQTNATQLTDLATSSQRVAGVLRSTTDIISVGTNDLTVYAYFYPNNAYVSQIRYYLNGQSTILYADVTPMSANPPNGTPVTANKKTYTIMNNYYKAPGTDLFGFLDASGNIMTFPISDQHTIKGIQTTLGIPGTNTATPAQGSQTMSIVVSLRNRKTNL